MPTKTNWEQVKATYIANPMLSLKDVAKKYGLSYAYLQQVSAKEGWVAQKKKVHKDASEEALKEVEGSLKDLIVRHAKVARWLQNAGLSRLQKRINTIIEAEKTNKKVRGVDDRVLLALVAEGLKAERELYPKQLQIQGDVSVEASGISKSLDKAIYLAFRKGLGRKRPSIHNVGKTKK